MGSELIRGNILSRFVGPSELRFFVKAQNAYIIMFESVSKVIPGDRMLVSHLGNPVLILGWRIKSEKSMVFVR